MVFKLLCHIFVPYECWFLSCPCSLLGSNFLITFKRSSSIKFIVFKDSFVLHNNYVGKLLLVSIWVHCFVRNKLNNSCFSLKSTNNWLLWIKGGRYTGNFFVTENTFQYGPVIFRIDFINCKFYRKFEIIVLFRNFNTCSKSVLHLFKVIQNYLVWHNS